MKRVCSIEGCERFVVALGWCSAHHRRWKRHGDPQGGRADNGAAVAWLVALVADPGEGCRTDWPFTTSDGYPVVHRGGKLHRAVRVVCELAYGEPPTQDHVGRHGPCHDTMCLQPAHLSWGTRRENTLDMLRDDSMARGSRMPTAKLNESQVLEIKRRIAAGCKQVDLASEYGVSKETIGSIHRGINWAWLVPD